MTMPMINDHNHELWEFYVMAVMHLCNVLMPLWGFLISSLNLDKSRNNNFSATFQMWAAYDVQAGAVCPLLPTGLQHHDWEEKEEEGAPSEVPACNPSPLSPSTHPHTFTFFNTFFFHFHFLRGPGMQPITSLSFYLHSPTLSLCSTISLSLSSTLSHATHHLSLLLPPLPHTFTFFSTFSLSLSLACNPSPLSPSTHPHTFTFFNTFSLSLSLAFDHWQAGCFSTERKCARFLSFQIYWPHLDNSQFSFLFRTTTNPTSIFF